MADHDAITDTLGRPLRDLRISVTDRCNFRCTYCMPKALFEGEAAFLPRSQLLSFAEIERLARNFAAQGVRKIRLTGGEPLLRPQLERLVAALAQIPGIEDIALTTNGSLVTPAKARALRDAGLNRMTVSLDALDEATFQAINDVGVSVAQVLAGIENAAAAGLTPIKINAVIKRGANEGSILPLARQFRGSGHIVRFIEYMDVGTRNGWRWDNVVSAAEICDAIDTRYPIAPLEPNHTGEVAERWQYRDGAGEIGIIASVTQPFCGSCRRARLSAEGALHTCLFASEGHDLRGLLRGGASDGEFQARIAAIWQQRRDRYSELRAHSPSGVSKVEMSYIGG